MVIKEQTYTDIITNIKSRNYAPIYLLMGDEPYYLDRITNLLLATVLNEEEKEFNEIMLYGADSDAAKILNTVRRYPMMSEYQLVVVREAQEVRDLDLLINYCQKPLESTILVINYKYKSLDKRSKIVGAITKNGVVFESKKIPEYKIQTHIQNLAQDRKLTIEPKALQMLADFLGNDLNKIDKELEKLSVLLPDDASKRRITPELIEKNIGISKDFNNFELLNAVIDKDVLKANQIAQYFGKNPKNNPLQVTLSVLFNYFSNLFICFYSKPRNEQTIMLDLKLKTPYQTRAYLKGLENYKPMKVFNLISDIRRADAMSKGVNNVLISESELLKELLYKIMH